MDKTKVGEWKIIFDGPFGQSGNVLSTKNEAVHMNLIHRADGKWLVLLYSGFDRFNNAIKTSIVDLHPPYNPPHPPPHIPVDEIEVPSWDESAWTTPHTRPSDTRGRIFCSGHVMLEDGKLIVVGGHRVDPDDLYTYDYLGLPTTYIYDPNNGSLGTWEHLNSHGRPLFMYQGRWYPTVTRLSNNQVIVVSGWQYDYTDNDPPEHIFNSKVERYPGPNGGWEILQDIDGNDLVLPFSVLYPGAHLIPFDNVNNNIKRGEVFYTMPMTKTWRLNVDKNGSPKPSFNEVVERSSIREHCNSILLTIEINDPNRPTPNMKVLLLGGHNMIEAINTTEMIDLANTGTLDWVAKEPLKIPRYNCNSVILPDKRLFVIGGSQGNGLRENCVTIPELYNPYANNGNGSTKVLLANTYQRMYHSTAILTPDATVLISGGELPNTLGDGNKNMEIYSPPYLCQDAVTYPRPVITTDLTNINYGVNFDVNKSGTIVSVMLIRFGCPTHAFDQDQRAVELYFTSFHNTLTITPPLNSYIAPAGKYMLFILTNGPTDPDDGTVIRIPSVAVILNLS